MEFSQEDKDLLEGLANVQKVVDVTLASKACEKLCETAIRQRDPLAIIADALRLCSQVPGIKLETKEWQEFFDLASGIEEREKSNRKCSNTSKRRFR